MRAERKAVKAAVREPAAYIADLQARAESTSSSVVVILHRERRKPMTLLQEHDLRELVALWAEVKAALEVRAGPPDESSVRRISYAGPAPR